MNREEKRGKAICLFEKQLNQDGHYEIIQNYQSIKELKSNFLMDAPVSVIVAAGVVGMGKSTWLNMLVHQADIDNTNDELYECAQIFKSLNSANSVTEGVWCYSKPLYWKRNRTRQILLVDLEGFGGISSEKEKTAIKLLFLIGSLIGTSIAMHVNNRPCQIEIDILQQVCQIIKIMNKKSQNIQPFPFFTLFLSKTNETEEKDIKKFLKNLKKNEKLNEQFIENLQIRPQHLLIDNKYPKRYLDEQDTFITDSLEDKINQQKDFIHKNSIYTFSQFLVKMEKIAQTVNQSDFKKSFQDDVLQVIEEEIRVIQTEISKKFKIFLEENLPKDVLDMKAYEKYVDQFCINSEQQKRIQDCIAQYNERIKLNFSDIILENEKTRTLFEKMLMEFKSTISNEDSRVVSNVKKELVFKKELCQRDKKIDQIVEDNNKKIDQIKIQGKKELEKVTTDLKEKLNAAEVKNEELEGHCHKLDEKYTNMYRICEDQARQVDHQSQQIEDMKEEHMYVIQKIHQKAERERKQRELQEEMERESRDYELHCYEEREKKWQEQQNRDRREMMGMMGSMKDQMLRREQDFQQMFNNMNQQHQQHVPEYQGDTHQSTQQNPPIIPPQNPSRRHPQNPPLSPVQSPPQSFPQHPPQNNLPQDPHGTQGYPPNPPIRIPQSPPRHPLGPQKNPPQSQPPKHPIEHPQKPPRNPQCPQRDLQQSPPNPPRNKHPNENDDKFSQDYCEKKLKDYLGSKDFNTCYELKDRRNRRNFLENQKKKIDLSNKKLYLSVSKLIEYNS